MFSSSWIEWEGITICAFDTEDEEEEIDDDDDDETDGSNDSSAVETQLVPNVQSHKDTKKTLHVK
jgi:hypothetical protein